MKHQDIIAAIKQYQSTTRAERDALISAAPPCPDLGEYSPAYGRHLRAQRDLRYEHATKFIGVRAQLEQFKLDHPEFEEAPIFKPHDPDSMDELIEYLGGTNE